MPDRPLDLEALRAFAEAARPGPWEARRSIAGDDAAYIARFDPSTVLALIDRAKRADRLCEAALGALDVLDVIRRHGLDFDSLVQAARAQDALRAALAPTEGKVERRCGQIMVGYGTDWHPTCRLPTGHDGPHALEATEGEGA